MAQLFLTSVGANVLDDILPHLNRAPADLRVLFIPTAANVNEDKSYVLTDKNKLLSLGFHVTELDLSQKQPSEIRNVVRKSDIIYVAGGNTFYLLQEIRESGFDTMLKEFLGSGGIYIGSSAGSAVLCPSIEYIRQMDDPTLAPRLKSFTGLQLVDFLVLPHYDDESLREKFTLIQQEYGAQHKILSITDNQFVFVNNGRIKILPESGLVGAI